MQAGAEKFIQLQEELMAYRKAMNSALDIILEREITEYPIFIAHQDTFDAGIPIIKRHEVNGNWNINVSTLEEFIQKKIIQPNKVNAFKAAFKSPQDYICFFVLSELGAQFIYLPRA